MNVTSENIDSLQAELELLELFDKRRAREPGDRGAGARRKEIEQRRLELEPYAGSILPPNALDLASAFTMIGIERRDRAERVSRRIWNELAGAISDAANLELDRAELRKDAVEST